MIDSEGLVCLECHARYPLDWAERTMGSESIVPKYKKLEVAMAKHTCTACNRPDQKIVGKGCCSACYGALTKKFKGSVAKLMKWRAENPVKTYAQLDAQPESPIINDLAIKDELNKKYYPHIGAAKAQSQGTEPVPVKIVLDIEIRVRHTFVEGEGK